MSDFRNVYEDDSRAAAYDKLEFPGTYHLAFRDLPGLFARHVTGSLALDFGCGTGRSTRFLERNGFAAVGVDIAGRMLARARDRDPGGDYRLVPDGDLSGLTMPPLDLVLSAFTFDNVPTAARKLALLAGLRDLLAPEGRFVNLVSSPEIYVNEWTSFSTKGFPENRRARSGDTVRIVMLDVEDGRPVEDVLWLPEDYAALYAKAGLEVLETHRPLGRMDDPFAWVSETEIAPWTIDVLGRAG